MIWWHTEGTYKHDHQVGQEIPRLSQLCKFLGVHLFWVLLVSNCPHSVTTCIQACIQMSALHIYHESLKSDIDQSGLEAVPTYLEEMDTNCVSEC